MTTKDHKDVAIKPKKFSLSLTAKQWTALYAKSVGAPLTSSQRSALIEAEFRVLTLVKRLSQ